MRGDLFPTYHKGESHHTTHLRILLREAWINSKRIKRCRNFLQDEQFLESHETCLMEEEDEVSREFNKLYGKVCRECIICRLDMPLRQFTQDCDRCNYELCMTCRLNIDKCPHCRLVYKNIEIVDLT